ncbi:MAG TPA: peptidylprolyl isomerase [Polyangiales bacterium]|nr:peptidylprolyl isomerase [Polyangiales bacterium]
MNVRLVLLIGLVGCARKAEPHFENRAPVKEEPAPVAVQAQEPVKVPPPPEAPPSMLDMPVSITRSPTSPDPKGGKFTLSEALDGLPEKGKLEATIETALGTITCKLFDDKAPNTVANFVGLARGLRPWWDARQAAWVTRPAYDNTSFHRAIAGFMIQGGDVLGDGSGELGYVIDDELAPGLSHDRAGLLCMANRGPNTNSGQFFITDAAAPHLTQMKSYSIFGECKPLGVISKIARAPRKNPMMERPEPTVAITTITIARK